MAVRVAKDILEALTQASAAHARVAAARIEVLTQATDPSARVAYSGVEAYTQATAPHVRVPAVYLEVLVSATPRPQQTVNLAPYVEIIPIPGGFTPPQPGIVGIDQLGIVTRVYVQPDAFTGSHPTASLKLYSGPFINGPWTEVVAQPIDQLARINVLTDPTPAYGRVTFYVATTIDTEGFESKYSAPVVSLSHVQVD